MPTPSITFRILTRTVLIGAVMLLIVSPLLRADGHGSATSAPVLVVTPLEIDFGSTACGSTACRQLTLRNTGDTDLSVTRIVVPAPFTVDDLGPFSIAAGGTRVLQICHVPTQGARSDSAMLVIESSQLPPATIRLRGRATRPVLAADSASYTVQSLRAGYSRSIHPTIRNTGDAVLTQVRVASTPSTIRIVTLPTLMSPDLSYQMHVVVTSPTLGPGQARFFVRYAPCGATEDSVAITIRWTATEELLLSSSGPATARPGSPVVFTIRGDETHAPPPERFRIDISYDRLLLMSEAGARGRADDVILAGMSAEGFANVTVRELYSADTATLRIEMSGGSSRIGTVWGPILQVRLTPLVGPSRTARVWISGFDYGTPYVTADLGITRSITLDSLCNYDLRLLDAHGRSATILSFAPNPIEPQSVVHVELARAGRVRMVMRDLLGREIDVMPELELAVGQHAVPIPGDLSSHSVYVLEVQHPEGGDARMVVTGGGWRR